mmetsp:Transcript_4591/g.9681  ORF Transcript_4591/g.9681 Transcript_4591/m.9681 type:complete len:201 (+) Transcript_4591:253-855(+)
MPTCGGGACCCWGCCCCCCGRCCCCGGGCCVAGERDMDLWEDWERLMASVMAVTPSALENSGEIALPRTSVLRSGLAAQPVPAVPLPRRLCISRLRSTWSSRRWQILASHRGLHAPGSSGPRPCASASTAPCASAGVATRNVPPMRNGCEMAWYAVHRRHGSGSSSPVRKCTKWRRATRSASVAVAARPPWRATMSARRF